MNAFELLKSRGETVAFAESLTGGLIAAALIENPGASDVIGESYVTYAEAAKVRLLGVRKETLERLHTLLSIHVCLPFRQ